MRWSAIATPSERTARSTSDSTISWPTKSGLPKRYTTLAREPFTEPARTAVVDYLSGHQRGRLGSVETSPEMFGLREDDLRSRFAPYVERFLT